MNTPISEAYNQDCMDFLRQCPDNYFSLAVCDPPYGIGASDYKRGGTQHGASAARCQVYEKKEWDSAVPNAAYFEELRRVSKNQIIWGGNYFHLPPSPCWIVWDKDNGENGYADFEIAWTSFDGAGRFARITWHGMRQHDMKNKEKRIHQTQKPVALYRWIFQNYARPGHRILDTHLGSGSSRIAAYDMGLDFYATELDPDYFAAMEARFKAHIAKPQLFAPEQQYTFKQAELFGTETLEK